MRGQTGCAGAQTGFQFIQAVVRWIQHADTITLRSGGIHPVQTEEHTAQGESDAEISRIARKKLSEVIGKERPTFQHGSRPDEPVETFTIVGSTEAKPGEGRISNESPVGRALLGKKKGEKVVVKVPAGDFTYKITSIS